jgi:hypothetical protein
VINWTATYRHDSDIPTPYAKFFPFTSSVKNISDDSGSGQRHYNYANKKSKLVAWFVSNCNAKNNRFQYAQELKRFIQVDIYGRYVYFYFYLGLNFIYDIFRNLFLCSRRHLTVLYSNYEIIIFKVWKFNLFNFNKINVNRFINKFAYKD